jgi:hypothetical protein
MSVATSTSVYEYQQVRMDRTVSRRAATRLLTEHAEYGHWELARVRVYPDGSRRAWLRRRIIKARAATLP